MGMDIYLYKVLPPDHPNSEEVEKHYLHIECRGDEPMTEAEKEYPEWLWEMGIEEDYECVDDERLFRDYGINKSELIGIGFDEKYETFLLKDGREIVVPWEEIDRKYTYIGKARYVKVKEIDYARYNYCGEDCFREDYHPLDIDLPIEFFKPEDMDEWVKIFKNKEYAERGWIRIRNRFAEELKKGEKVFVFVSY